MVVNEFDILVGTRLRAIRNDRGMTLKNLAHRTGTDFTHLSKVETGNRPLRLNLVPLLCHALDCTSKDLLGV